MGYIIQIIIFIVILVILVVSSPDPDFVILTLKFDKNNLWLLEKIVSLYTQNYDSQKDTEMKTIEPNYYELDY